MGCTESRSKLIEEEAIVFAEDGLRFSKSDAETVNATMRSHSLGGKVNPLQLARISEELGVQFTNTHPHTKVQTLLKKFRQFDQEYCLEDLLVLGILLSQGTAFTKASLLFQVFSTPEQTIALSSLKTEVLHKLSSISRSLSCLVTNQQGKGAMEMKVSRFSENLAQVQAGCISQVAQHMGLNGAQVTQDTFVRVLRTFRSGALVNASGWRLFMHEAFLKLPQLKEEASTPTSTTSK